MQIFLTRILVFVAGVFIGLGVAAITLFVIEDNTTSLDQSKSSARETKSVQLSNTADSVDRSEFEEVDSRLENLVFPRSTFDRKAGVLFWVASLSDDQIVNYLEQSTDLHMRASLENPAELQTALLEKLTTTAPHRAADFALSIHDRHQYYSLTHIVFQTWANLDFEGAVAHLKELTEQESRIFMRTIFAARDDLSFEQMRAVALELGEESYAFSVYFQSLVNSGKNTPKETWYEIVNLANREHVQHTTGSVLPRIAVAWVEDQGLNVLDEIVSSISNDAEYLSVLYDLLRDLASEQPEEVFDFVMNNLGDRAVEVLKRSGITNQWIQKDPKGLLAKLDSIPATRFRQAVLLNAIQQWADNNPRELLARLDLVPPGQRDDASNRAIRKLSRISPTETAQFILHLTDDASQSRFAQILISQWVDDDAEAAKEWVLSLPVRKPMRASLISDLARTLVRTNPRSAFELALHQPLDNDDDSPHKSIGDEVFILSRIADQDVHLAIEFLPKVRNGGKASAYTDVGTTLVEQGNLHQALELANHLDEREKSEFFQAVAMDWYWKDPKGLLREFDDFPTSSKSTIALAMTFSNRITGHYTDEEIEQLERHIGEKDKKMLEQLQEIDLSNPTDEEFEMFYKLHL